MRRLALAILTLVNIFIFFTNMEAFGFHGAAFNAPWDGPAVVTIVLAAATLVMAAVAIGVALIAIWGYTTLREHAGNVANERAAAVAEQVANGVMQAWLDRRDRDKGDADSTVDRVSLADAYKGDAQ